MGDDDLGAPPVELPARHLAPLTTRRRHRLLSGTSGILLFVCLFLPAVKGCSAPIVPLDMPPLWAPYIIGLVFACIAMSRTERAIAGGTTALRAVAALHIVGGVLLFVQAPGLALIVLSLGFSLGGLIGWRTASERRLALAAVLLGLACAGWFAMWTLSPGALLGVKLSLASSLGLVAGGLVWLVDLARPPSVVPEAIARRRR